MPDGPDAWRKQADNLDELAQADRDEAAQEREWADKFDREAANVEAKHPDWAADFHERAKGHRAHADELDGEADRLEARADKLRGQADDVDPQTDQTRAATADRQQADTLPLDAGSQAKFERAETAAKDEAHRERLDDKLPDLR